MNCRTRPESNHRIPFIRSGTTTADKVRGSPFSSQSLMVNDAAFRYSLIYQACAGQALVRSGRLVAEVSQCLTVNVTPKTLLPLLQKQVVIFLFANSINWRDSTLIRREPVRPLYRTGEPTQQGKCASATKHRPKTHRNYDRIRIYMHGLALKCQLDQFEVWRYNGLYKKFRANSVYDEL